MNDPDYKALEARLAELERSNAHVIAASKLIVKSIQSVIKGCRETNDMVLEIAKIVGVPGE